MNRRLEPLSQRVRARTGKHTLLDTTDAHLLFEDQRHPWRAIPRDALRIPLAGPPVADPTDGHWWAIDVNGTRRDRAVRAWATPPADLPGLAGLLVIHHDAADQWLEEEQPVPGMPGTPTTGSTHSPPAGTSRSWSTACPWSPPDARPWSSRPVSRRAGTSHPTTSAGKGSPPARSARSASVSIVQEDPAVDLHIDHD